MGYLNNVKFYAIPSRINLYIQCNINKNSFVYFEDLNKLILKFTWKNRGS